MKFDFAIGNPPYQETKEDTSDSPVYNNFMDAAYKIADKVEFITPARFLFNAGKTPKAWNAKMLNDEHFKVLEYEPNSEKIFRNTEIKGGVAISYYSNNDNFGAIEIFTQDVILNVLLRKIRSKATNFVDAIVFSPESYRFTDAMHDDYPDVESLLSNGHKYDITSNIFEKIGDIVFMKTNPSTGQYVAMLGRLDNSRLFMYIKRTYIAEHPNLDKYKLAFPKVNGNGDFGEVLTAPEVLLPGMGHTQTFLSMGAFNTKDEAINLSKYLKTKFSRTMLGILKVTQDNKKGVWKYVPLQDFTDKSDIDWSVSIANIDKQLYKKYGLSEDEINFIETHVKEME